MLLSYNSLNGFIYFYASILSVLRQNSDNKKYEREVSMFTFYLLALLAVQIVCVFMFEQLLFTADCMSF